MPYIYSRVEDLDQTDLVGSQQGAVLVQHYANAPATLLWKEGKSVKGEYECPAHVSLASVDAGEIPSSWKAYSQPNKLKVVSAGLSDGEPSEMAFLKPSETKHRGNLAIVKWKLEGEHPSGIWLSCDYEGNFFSLARELPIDIKECDVVYQKVHAHSTKINSITCK